MRDQHLSILPRLFLPVVCGLLLLPPEFALLGQVPEGSWQRTELATEEFHIQGTGGRHNPLRKKLNPEWFGDQIFVRFQLRYSAKSIDHPPEGNGEFFVFWFDAAEGTDGSPHANNVPNIGLHTDGNKNRFMVRYRSDEQQFGQPLVGDRDYLIVGRLYKSGKGEQANFDRLEMWVDPVPKHGEEADLTASNEKAISHVSWVGFSTGAKTEIGDEIVISKFRLGRSWAEIMDLPSKIESSETSLQAKEKTVSFNRDVLPILENHCFECHRGNFGDTDLAMDQFDQVLNQVTPFEASRSKLYQLLSEGEMPPSPSSLSSDELRVIKAWIDEGLDWDHQQFPATVPSLDHWAFMPIKKPRVPSVVDSTTIKNPIDAFIRRSQETIGVVANPTATPEQLQRRIHLDVTGLPPTYEERQRELSIGDLLSTIGYGERWGRYWLDVARWAESNGYQHNRDREHAWRYRDWVVNAFTTGMDFRTFVTSQIAGDMLVDGRDRDLIATGFLTSARYSGNELDKSIQRNDILNDVTSNVGSTFLGLTVQCAQCHDHKFDPITIRDYYQLQGFFSTGQPQNLLLTNDQTIEYIAAKRQSLIDTVRSRVIRVRRQQNFSEPILVTPETVRSQMQPGEKQLLKEYDSRLQKSDQTWGFYAPSESWRVLTVMPHEMRWPLSNDPDVVSSHQPRILVRGDIKTPGPIVASDWPLAFRGEPQTEKSPTKTRVDLANWIVSPGNPLAARVWVNRLWQWHFGRGLVQTSNDFGTQGTKPTHPDLLDYLASELIQSEWDTNHIQRLILDSATFRRSSHLNPDNQLRDPENLTYWRWQPRRLEAEVIRDSMLVLAGQLDETVGGESQDFGSKRRSLYLKQKRGHFPNQQDLFDGPDGVVSCAQRQTSTNALQPLWLLNSGFVQEMAEAFARRSGSVRTAVQMAFNRDATDEEMRRLNALAAEHGLQSVCLVLFNSSEFLYLP